MAGGQLMLTREIENYPGFSEGILGPALMTEMRKQAERFGAEVIDVDVESVDFKQKPMRIVAGNRSVSTNAVIIATGSSAKWLGIRSEEKLRGRGVSSCATCDGYFFRNKRVAVIGGGDTALEEALFLTKYATEVVLVHRRDRLRASRIMQKRAFSNPRIRFLWDSVVDDMLGEDRLEGLKIRNVKTNRLSMLPCDGVFVAIGFQPNTKIFQGQIDLDERGYVLVREGTKSSAEGVFVAGDVHDYKYRQAITAAGEGCKAAIDALSHLEEQKEIAFAAPDFR
jgi:thioredoxin reductase (NADPH)